MRKEYDFSKGERGMFYRADMKLNIPIYLDEEVPTNTPIAGVNVYEPVPGLQASVQYAVRICAATNTSQWNSASTFETRAQPSWPGDSYYDNVKDWSHSYFNFEMTKPVTVEISRVNGQHISSAKVRPERKAKNIYISGGKAYLTLNQPCNVAVGH